MSSDHVHIPSDLMELFHAIRRQDLGIAEHLGLIRGCPAMAKVVTYRGWACTTAFTSGLFS